MLIHVVGDAFCDIVASGLPGLPRWGGDVKAKNITPFAGGSALNTAVHVRGLLEGAGSQVVLHTALGASDMDWASLVLQQNLVRNGVRLVAKRVPGTTTGVCIVLSGCGERAFATCNGAITHLCKDDFDIKTLADCDHIHFGGVYALTSLMNDLAALLKEVREYNPHVTISLDTNYDSTGAWGQPWLAAALPLIDILKLNELEAGHVQRAHGNGDNAADLEASVSWLASRVRTAAVVTRGKDGAEFALSSSPNDIFTVESLQVDVVDPVGAGDAFNAGLIVRWLENKSDFAAAARFACMCGALNVTNLGACNVPVSRARVKALETNQQPNTDSKRVRVES